MLFSTRTPGFSPRRNGRREVWGAAPTLGQHTTEVLTAWEWVRTTCASSKRTGSSATARPDWNQAGGASVWKATTANGGRMISSDWGWPCDGMGTESAPPRLPWPLPP